MNASIQVFHDGAAWSWKFNPPSTTPIVSNDKAEVVSQAHTVAQACGLPMKVQGDPVPAAVNGSEASAPTEG